MDEPTVGSDYEVPFSARSGGARKIQPRFGHFLGASYVDEQSEPSQLIFRWVGRLFFGIALIVFGGQEFVYSGQVGDLGLLGGWMPADTVLAWVAGTLLIVAGVAVLTGIYTREIAVPMGVVFAAAAVLRFTPAVPEMWKNWGDRGVPAELFASGAGMWMLAAMVRGGWPSDRTARRLAGVGLAVFGVAHLVFGSIHLQVGPTIASLIPAWLPERLFLAYATGVALVAAGLVFLAGRWVRPGVMRATGLLLGLMYFSWVVIVHAPRIAHALHNGDEWNSGYVCLMMAGIAFLAGTGRPGGSASRARR
jgi:uncharacterized membrane protein YphA (DoxX/SURF4 family)